jgi:hypothetical protein
MLKNELATFSAGYQLDKRTLIHVETMEEITSERLGSSSKPAVSTSGRLPGLVGNGEKSWRLSRRSRKRIFSHGIMNLFKDFGTYAHLG